MLLRLFGLWTRAILRMRGVRRAHRKLGGFDVRFYRHGAPDAEPWLLLHGLGSTAHTWHATISALGDDCRLWVPELSELGGTHGPSPAMNVRQATTAMTELIGAESPGRPVTVCGISLGGWVAVRLALERPDLVERLVLINCGGFGDQDWPSIERMVRVRTLADVDRLYSALFLDAPTVLRLSKSMFLDAFRSPAVEHVVATLSQSDAFDERDLSAIECPTQLIWGRHDGLFPLATGRRMAAAIPDARLTVLEAAHGVHWEFPHKMNEAIAEFRQRTKGRRP